MAKPTDSKEMERQAATLGRALLAAYSIRSDDHPGLRKLAEAAYLATLKGSTCLPLHKPPAKDEQAIVAMEDKTGQRLPLVLRARGKKAPEDPAWSLYLQRYDALESAFADNILKRLDIRCDAHDMPPGLLQGCDDTQAAAIRLSTQTQLMLLTGGPGTGKTLTATRILAAAVMSGRTPIDRIRLCAPTGRAASRLRESVVLQLAGLRDVADLDIGRLQPATTLHSLLRQQDIGTARMFLVDECSMIDFHIFDRFLRAASVDAKIVLIGDPRQLPSVDTGSVFADLCKSKRMERALVTLKVNHRLPPAIHKAARHVIGEVADGAAECIEPDKDDIVRACLVDYRKLVIAAQDGKVESLDPMVNSVRVLCSHRGGPTGCVALNLAIQEALGLRTEGQPGQVVMVTRNDPKVTGLMNGDVGVVIPGRRAKFFGKDGTFSLTDLRDTEPAFATTIHKAQGSEYERVLLVLSDSDQEDFLTRELLFTGITRAKRFLGPGVQDKPSIYASKTALATMLRNKVARMSGLAERLGGEMD